jgi:hypothetical protein
LNIAEIVSELKAERSRIDGALAALKGHSPSGATSVASRQQAKVPAQKRGGLSAAGRKRLSHLVKNKWAERRKKKGSAKG